MLKEKSTTPYLKIFLLLIAVSFSNINCEHCDDEDYTIEQEEKISVQQHTDTITLIKT